jgi:hypothetical protein
LPRALRHVPGILINFFPDLLVPKDIPHAP